jgi:hypothetical protein
MSLTSEREPNHEARTSGGSGHGEAQALWRTQTTYARGSRLAVKLVVIEFGVLRMSVCRYPLVALMILGAETRRGVSVRAPVRSPDSCRPQIVAQCH